MARKSEGMACGDGDRGRNERVREVAKMCTGDLDKDDSECEET